MNFGGSSMQFERLPNFLANRYARTGRPPFQQIDSFLN